MLERSKPNCTLCDIHERNQCKRKRVCTCTCTCINGYGVVNKKCMLDTTNWGNGMADVVPTRNVSGIQWETVCVLYIECLFGKQQIKKKKR